MGRKKNSLSVFDKALQESGLSDEYGMESISNMDGDDNLMNNGIDNIDDIEQPEDNDPAEDKNDEGVDPLEDNTDIPPHVLNNNRSSEEQEIDEQDDDEDDDLVENVDENESAQVGAFFDAFAESLGWDVEEDEKPNSIESLIEYIQDVVDQNSQPEYADDRIKQLDEYVKNGGKFEDFYNVQSESIAYEDMDLDDESNQKAVIREYLKMSGYTDQQINKKIERYEDADMLSEESEEAYDRLKLIKEQQIQYRQQQQEQMRAEQERQVLEFTNGLNSTISNLDNIRGISIPKEDRKALFNYITKIDADGYTQYQKDFNKNLVNNLIESAYFTMKGDTLLGEAKRNGETSAAKKLRNMLKHQSKNHTRYNVQDEKQRSVADIASKWL